MSPLNINKEDVKLSYKRFFYYFYFSIFIVYCYYCYYYFILFYFFFDKTNDFKRRTILSNKIPGTWPAFRLVVGLADLHFLIS